MQLHKAICAPSLGNVRISRCLLCKQHTQRKSGRAAVLVVSNAKLPQSTSSWTPFGWELNTKFDSKYAKVGEYTAHYLKAGQGKTVILMIASQVVLARSYRSTVNAMSREHTVVCLELPGCGRSDSVKQPFTHQQYADWIVQFLIYMDITKAVVIGHSCSTAPAIALAESHSSFVSHLILVSAIGMLGIYLQSHRPVLQTSGIIMHCCVQVVMLPEAWKRLSLADCGVPCWKFSSAYQEHFTDSIMCFFKVEASGSGS